MTRRAYKTETLKYQVGCGELRVSISFRGDESFHFILLHLDNQDSQCGCCWLEVNANLLTALIRRLKEEEIPEIIKNLTKQRCKYEIKSCPNAIGEAIKVTLQTQEKGNV